MSCRLLFYSGYLIFQFKILFLKMRASDPDFIIFSKEGIELGKCRFAKQV